MRTTWWTVLVVLSGCVQPGVDEPELIEPSSGRELLQVEGFAPNPGAVKLFFFAPSAPKPSTGLVVALHGCLQTAAEYQRVGWNALAEAKGFYVLYVESSSPNGCFRWFEPSQATRGQGEVASVVAGVDWVLQRYSVDRRRVFVTGLSAGAGLSTALLAAAPDVFSAGAVFAGVPAGCATSATEGLACMSGVDLDAAAWAERAHFAGGAVPRIQVWTGQRDTTVAPSMARELVEQWTRLHGVPTVPTEREPLVRAQSELYGAGQVQLITIEQMGHAVPVAPSAGCGSAGPFVSDVGLCGAREAARFFGLLDEGPVAPVTLLDAGEPPSPPPDAGAGVGATDGGVAGCREAFASPTWHVWLWRAEVCGFFKTLACGRGSGELLGSTLSSLPVWAASDDGETWRAGRCPTPPDSM